MRYQPLLNMGFPQYFAAIAIVEVAHPAANGGMDIFQRDVRPASLCEPGDSVFDNLQGFLRRLNLGMILPRFLPLPHLDCEPEKIERMTSV